MPGPRVRIRRVTAFRRILLGIDPQEVPRDGRKECSGSLSPSVTNGDISDIRGEKVVDSFCLAAIETTFAVRIKDRSQEAARCIEDDDG